jgi:hypothetical protein
MAHEDLRQKLDALFAQLYLELDASDRLAIVKDYIRNIMSRVQAATLSLLDTDVLADDDWPALGLQMRQIMRALTDGEAPRLDTPNVGWMERLKNRQGTRIPDWSEFYAQREALERRIDGRES